MVRKTVCPREEATDSPREGMTVWLREKQTVWRKEEKLDSLREKKTALERKVIQWAWKKKKVSQLTVKPME